MKILDGKTTAQAVRAELKERVFALAKRGVTVGLAVLLVGEDPASKIYVGNKIKACEEAGIRSFSRVLPENATEEEAEAAVEGFAADPSVHGILVQLPLPPHLDERKILSRIPAEKDVDGFSDENCGRLFKRLPCIPACTPLGVMELLRRYEISVCGKRAVIVGRSNTVGRPMAALLLNADATVTVCHSKTKDLENICREADILVAAVGKPHFITPEMVKEGAVVIDVGISRVDGKIRGDVDPAAWEKASFVTPVPGGVGPMTVAMLLKNTVDAAERGL